jgi:hypothetical protein
MSSRTEYFNERFIHKQSFNQHPREQCQEKEMKKNSDSFTKPLFNEIKKIVFSYRQPPLPSSPSMM